MCRINHLKLVSAPRKRSSDIQIWTVFSAFVFSIGLPSPACILFLFFLPHLFLLSFHFCLDTLSMGYSMNCTPFIWFWHQWKLISEDVSQSPNILSDVVNHTHPSRVSHSPLIRSCAQVLPESDLVFPFPPMLTLSASLSKSLCFACFFHLSPHSCQFLTFLYRDSQLFLCPKSLLNSIVTNISNSCIRTQMISSSARRSVSPLGLLYCYLCSNPHLHWTFAVLLLTRHSPIFSTETLCSFNLGYFIQKRSIFKNEYIYCLLYANFYSTLFCFFLYLYSGFLFSYCYAYLL